MRELKKLLGYFGDCTFHYKIYSTSRKLFRLLLLNLEKIIFIVFECEALLRLALSNYEYYPDLYTGHHFCIPIHCVHMCCKTVTSRVYRSSEWVGPIDIITERQEKLDRAQSNEMVHEIG